MLTIQEYKKRLKDFELRVIPIREDKVQELHNYTIAKGDKVFKDKYDFLSYSAMILTVRASYNANATKGVKIRWMYSQDDFNFDSETDADDSNNSENLTFAAGETKQRTVIIPILTEYVRIQIVNLDTNYGVTIKDCYSIKFR